MCCGICQHAQRPHYVSEFPLLIIGSFEQSRSCMEAEVGESVKNVYLKLAERQIATLRILALAKTKWRQSFWGCVKKRQLTDSMTAHVKLLYERHAYNYLAS